MRADVIWRTSWWMEPALLSGSKMWWWRRRALPSRRWIAIWCRDARNRVSPLWLSHKRSMLHAFCKASLPVLVAEGSQPWSSQLQNSVHPKLETRKAPLGRAACSPPLTTQNVQPTFETLSCDDSLSLLWCHDVMSCVVVLLCLFVRMIEPMHRSDV